MKIAIIGAGNIGGAIASGLMESGYSAQADLVGSDPEEARFVREYVQTGREIKSEWLIYQKQPDNVFFSHALHFGPMADLSRPEEIAAFCSRCHLTVPHTDLPPVSREDRPSG